MRSLIFSRRDRSFHRLPSALDLTVVAIAMLAVAATSLAGESVQIDPDTAAELAMASSPLVASANARLEAVNGRAASADAQRMPVVALGAQLGYRSSVPEFAAPVGGPGEPPTVIFPDIQNTYALGVFADQLLYSGGRVNASRRSTGHEVEAANADRDGLLAILRAHGRTSFWRTVASEAMVVAANAEITRAERLLEDVRSLEEAGMAVAADRLAAEARVATARVRGIRSAADHRIAIAELRSQLGLEPSTQVVLSPPSMLPAPPKTLADLLTTARAERSELRAILHRIDAAREREIQASASRRPTVTMSAGWDLARPNQRFLPLTDTWNDSWRVGLGATWTVFDGQRTASAEATADAETDVLRSDSREIERQVELEVETARTGLTSALEATAAAEAARRAATAREIAERDRYQSGMAPISQVLDAQSELAAAEQEVISARATAWIADAVLDRAVGR